MKTKQIISDKKISDKEFDKIYKSKIRVASAIHFTPIEVANLASEYLVNNPKIRILDIGSGGGKFCLLGASSTTGIFTGVEMRQTFHEEAVKIANESGLNNIHFICSNITEIAFNDYDAFYIFNPFQENISVLDRINDEIPLNRALYEEYSAYVENQLDLKPSGTRIATYFSYRKEIPSSYQKVASHFGDKLVFWEKK